MGIKEIKSIAQLRAVVRTDAFTSLFGTPPDYKLALPSESDDTNNQLSILLNEYKNECGCFTGGIFMGMSVVGMCIYFSVSEAAFLELSWSSMLGVVGLVFGSSIIGKLIGLIWAKIQMLRIARRVEFSVSSE